MKSINEIKKELLRSKRNATFAYYAQGKLYYNIWLEDGEYQFPISILVRDAHGMKLSEEIGITHMHDEIRGSHLIRWIEKALNNDENEFIALFDNKENEVMDENHS